MKNEEKAKQLVEKYVENVFSTEKYSLADCLLEMAKWKDKQYAKVLAKLIIELDELKHQVKSLLP